MLEWLPTQHLGGTRRGDLERGAEARLLLRPLLAEIDGRAGRCTASAAAARGRGAVWPRPAPQRTVGPQFLVVVSRSEHALYEHLRRQLAAAPGVTVLVDRRQSSAARREPGMERRAGRHRARFLWGVAVIRRDDGALTPDRVRATHHHDEGGRMAEIEMLEERQRVDRWIEEGQYLLGRVIPGFLDDRERLRMKVAAAEEEVDRLRHEVGDLRRELEGARQELEWLHNERGAVTAMFGTLGDLVGQLAGPLGEIRRRLHAPRVMENVEPAA